MRYLILLLIVFLASCSNDRSKLQPLFTNVALESGIDFHNDLHSNERLNPYTYRNFYNGAGVAVGDINNDGLLDIYFAGNQADNKLYLNLGDFKFRDITATAGVACHGAWSTGVTFSDINGDGLLDIYVCKSGDPETPRRSNELFINNGNLTFTERSKEYGLDITGLSVQAAFFDYDKDGDLDCYLLTNSIKSVGNYDLVEGQREIPDPDGAGNKFLINKDGHFSDYSAEAGIFRSSIGFGLGITLGDFNEDTWTDIFVSNDFFERDYLYLNDQHGGFKESLTEYFGSISMGSMGADNADLDNDAVPELFVTEMLPDSLSRRKTKTVYESWNKYQLNVKAGYYHQFSRNVLQKKIDDDYYAEIARFSGVSASEWSWGALLFDMDNDGLRDIFIANGIFKDLLDRDYLTYAGADENVRRIIHSEKNPIVHLIDLMPSSKFSNYAFKNEGGLNFKNMASAWGLAEPSFSSGSAYGDFDNDGDLDLVINTINSASELYRNNSIGFNYITIALSTRTKNSMAVGATVTAYCRSKRFFADNFVTKGFQSSVQPRITLSLGDSIRNIDSLLIQWPDAGYTMLYNPPVNRMISIAREEAEVRQDTQQARTGNRNLRLRPVRDHLSLSHASSGLTDFNRDRLLPMMYSNETPAILKGDIDNDGTVELYVGGGKGQTGSFIVNRSGKFQSLVPDALYEYAISEETGGALADVDGDGDLDLYLATGGRAFPMTSSALDDKLLLNNGNGTFSASPYPLPFSRFVSTSVVAPIDFDRDGDIDFAVGERFDPFVYGAGGRGYLFQNDGKGRFQDVTSKYAIALQDIGMITDITVADFDKDGHDDIIVVGDWMPIVFLKNENGHFSDYSRSLGLEETHGWWHAIESGDFNKDGRMDFVIGNHGLNSFFRAGDRMYVNDFDSNGSVEQIFCTPIDGRYFPVLDKDDLLSQLPGLKKNLLFYGDYGKKAIDEIFPPVTVAQSRIFEAKILASIVLLSRDDGYEMRRLPAEAQYAPLYGLLAVDMDEDGVLDLLAGGNHYAVKPQFGRYDASRGWFFKGTLSDGKFSFLPGQSLDVEGEIRDIECVEFNNKRYVFFAKHGDQLEVREIMD